MNFYGKLKVKQRNIYLEEFQNFSFKQRFYYVWANEINVFLPYKYVNFNPLRMCIIDLFKIVLAPLYFLLVIPVIALPASIIQAYHLNKCYKEEDTISGWFKSNKFIIE